MGTPFVGEIRIFAGNFAPAGWAFCNGATLPISENTVLFDLIGTTYGGDGQSTFQLPDLQGRFPLHVGNALGNNFVIGQRAGTETVTLTTQQLPSHNHAAFGSEGGDSVTPGGKVWSTDPGGNTAAYTNNIPDGSNISGSMASNALNMSGSSQPHDNMSPFVVINYIISLFGIFPSQN